MLIASPIDCTSSGRSFASVARSGASLRNSPDRMRTTSASGVAGSIDRNDSMWTSSSGRTR